MDMDLSLFGAKLRGYRAQFQVSVREVSSNTGIPEDIIRVYEEGNREPTGDHVLILADYYMCDYKFFVSNDRIAPYDQTEMLFRSLGDRLTTEDRWAIQEFLFLCECEDYLLKLMPKVDQSTFAFNKVGRSYKEHGREAAKALRHHLGHGPTAVSRDIFRDLRRIGLHVFRRELQSSQISGLCIRHPTAGKCVLVNYTEDVFRQRFTAAHEAGHAILDDGTDPTVSYDNRPKEGLSEIRANTFASHYLMPRDLLRAIPNANKWDAEKLKEWALKLFVSCSALATALADGKLIGSDEYESLKAVVVPRPQKSDVELPVTMSGLERSRKEALLRRGLSTLYVGLCFDAYDEGHITAARLAEMVLVPENELIALGELYRRTLAYGN